MRKVVIGDCCLIHGDAMEVMPTLTEQAECIVCDPPYKLTYGGPHGSLGGCLSVENYDNKGGIVECDIDWTDFMPLFFQSMKQGHAYIMANNRHVQNMLNAAESAGFRFHNLLVWDKVNATPNRWYMKNCEFTGFFYKGKAEFINDCGAKQLISCPQVDESDHPTEKPVPLMQHYIKNSTQLGDTVLDPFMGSGTTGVAAVRSGRKFIGIELEERFFNIACERIRHAYDQGDMFAPKAVKPKQEAFI